MKQNALDIIRNEHRSIAAVLDGLRYFAHAVQADPAKVVVDFRAIRAMLHYLDVFAERFHHPKEDRYLFACIRRATHDGDATINSLQDDHARCEERTLQLMRAAIRAECEPSRYLRDFASEVERFVDHQWRHMTLEEDTILPMARRVLGGADWKRIDTAFHSNADPLVGVEAGKEFENLFSRVVSLAPAPIGLASEED